MAASARSLRSRRSARSRSGQRVACELPYDSQNMSLDILAHSDSCAAGRTSAQVDRSQHLSLCRRWQMTGSARTSVQTTIAAFILCCAALPSPAAEQAVTNKDIAKYLTEAKDLANGKHWDAAWAVLEKAERVPDASPYVKYKIDAYKGYVLTQQHKDAEAGALYEQLAKSEAASADERIDHLKKASQLYLRAKQYEKSARTAQAALEKQPNDPALLELAGQSQYLAGDFRGAAARIGQLVAATERKGAQPQEASLQ